MKKNPLDTEGNDSDKLGNEIVRQAQDKVECAKCSLEFNTINQLARHIRFIHPDIAELMIMKCLIDLNKDE